MSNRFMSIHCFSDIMTLSVNDKSVSITGCRKPDLPLYSIFFTITVVTTGQQPRSTVSEHLFAKV